MPGTFNSASYWDARYRAGATSGAGSYGRLANYKAAFINGMIEANHVAHVADFGCGDGNLLSLLRPPAYTGLDVSETALKRCTERFPNHHFMPFARAADLKPADLCLSIDVIYHLVEDDVFAAYMDALFAHAERLVLIYASNLDSNWPAAHVRHRRFSSHVATRFPGWRLRAQVPNLYPFDPAHPDDTSFSDFFVYTPPHVDCVLYLPRTAA
jgi:SAM-dependent methyltransferase